MLDRESYLAFNKGIKALPSKIVMALAPVNSSGDIYHLLAFTILSLYKKKDIPNILLTYDVEQSEKKLQTGNQVQRSIDFVNSLGYGEYFESEEVYYNNSGQASSRQKVLEEFLIDQKYKYYIDHRMSTVIVSKYFLDNGFEETAEILREGFSNIDREYIKKSTEKKIDAYVDSNIKLISDAYKKNEKKPVVILHDRYSDKANSEQDLAQMANIITARLKRDYTVVAIYADHRATKYNNLRDSLVDCRPFQENGIDNQDVGKLCHLRLLIKLYEQKKAIKLKGIIGNTSGTLDVAAFVGHNVFDIHKFSERFDYQDLRLMLQSTFLVVQKASDIMVMNGKNKPNQLLINMDSWIESGGEQPICSSYLSKPTINKGFHFLASVCNLQVGERGEWKKPAFMDSYLEEMEKYLVEVGFIKKGGLDLGFERS